MATVAKVVEMAATRLGILGEGETLPSYESDDLTQAYTEVFAQLGALNIAVWDFDEEVPDEYVGPVTDLVANARINDYGIPNDRFKRISGFAARALGNIKELKGGDTYVTTTPDYF